MDYQNFVVSRLGSDKLRILSTAKRMRDWSLSHSMPVYHCLVDTRSGAKPPAATKVAERWSAYEDALSASPELGDEAPELAATGESKLEKTVRRRPGFVSVLHSNGLEDELKRREVRSLILCGISTSGCVLSTARAASDEGFVVTVVQDACADPRPEVHELLVSSVLATTAHVVSANEVWDAWDGRV